MIGLPAKLPMWVSARGFASALALCGAMCGALPAHCEPVEAQPSGAASGSGVVAAGTLVAVRVDQELSSGHSKRGDTFPITLMNDLWVGNRVVVPAGTKGMGEVIHAAGKGFGGRAGELIVTARYLQVGDKRLRLGHFRLSAAGANNATAALLTTAAVPIIGVFVTGTSATIGLGQMAQAKVAEDFPNMAETNSAQASSAETNSAKTGPSTVPDSTTTKEGHE